MRNDQLGVQVHCLRHRIAAEGLQAVLSGVTALGVVCVEWVSFPGCRGNPWGDFGAATDMPPAGISAALATARLRCPSVMVSEAELSADRLDATLAWIEALGCRRVSLTALHPVESAARWPHFLERVHACARRCQDRGFDFLLHTQPELWAAAEGLRPAEALLTHLDISLLRLEYDPSGAIQFGADPVEYLCQRPEAFYAVHLRDARRPSEPTAYLPADALGQGSVNWPDFLGAAQRCAIEWYFLEMETADPSLTQSALESSLSHLRRAGLIESAAQSPS